MANTSEKFTVNLVARTKAFVKNMAQATKAMKMVGDMNRGIIKNLQGMSSAATKAGAKFNQTQQKMRNGVTETERATKKGAASWKKYFKIFAVGTGAVAGFSIVLLGLSRLLKRARIGAAIQVQARAFANLAASHGENAKKMMMDLRAASKGTVDNIQIMTTASRAIMLGIAPAKLVKLMEIARASAKAMGTTVQGAFSDIALGIGRQSRLILDNLGIIVRVAAAYQRYAFSIGVTADALTDFERQQAFANETIRFGQNTIRNINPSFIDLQDRLAQIDTTMKNVSQTVNLQLAQAFVTLFNILEKRQVISSILKAMEVKLPKVMADVIGLMLTLVEVADDTFSRIVVHLRQSAKISENLAIWIVGLATAVVGLGATLLTLNPLVGAVAATAAFAASTAAVAGLNKVLQEFGEITSGGDFTEGSFADILSKNIAKTRKEFEELGDAWKKGLTPDRTQLEIALSKLRGFNTEADDGLTSAKDLLNTWTQLQNNIKRAKEQIRDAALDMAKIPEDADEWAARVIKGKVAFAEMPANVREFTKELISAESKLDSIRDNVLLLELEIVSTDELNKQARRAIAKLQRLLRDPNLLKTRKAQSIVYEALFKGISDRAGELSPEVKEVFLALQKEFASLKEIANTLPDSFIKGLNTWVDEYKNVNNRMTQIGIDTAKAISAGFQNFFFDAVTGQLKGLRETFANFGTSILKSVSKALGDKATEEILGIFKISGNTKLTNSQDQLRASIDDLKDVFDAYTASQTVTPGAPNPVVLKALQAQGNLPTTLVTPVPATGAGAGAGAATVATASTTGAVVQAQKGVFTKMKEGFVKFFQGIGGFFSKMFQGITGLFSSGGASGGGGGFFSNILGGIGKIFGKGSGGSGGSGGFFSNILGGVKKIFFADGGITSLAGGLEGAMMTRKPTLAAISETGKREAIVPLDKFAELIQQPSITINAIDTKSFQQYVNENKEVLLGAVNSVRSPQNTGQMSRGPF